MATEEKINKILVGVLTFMLALSVGLNTWMLIKRTETFPAKRQLIAEKGSLSRKLSQTLTELNTYKGVSMNIDKVIEDAEAKLAEKDRQIARLSVDKKLKTRENEMLLAEIDSLQEKYLSSIDSLLLENERVLVLNSRLDEMSEQINDLKTQLGYSKELIADNFVLEPLKMNNQGKTQSTALAKKTDKLRACYEIIQNNVAPSGDYTIYVVITAPNGLILTSPGLKTDEFRHPEYDKPAKFTALETINYKNQKASFCHEISLNDSLIPGLYVVEIFTDTHKMGMITFTLK